MKLIIVESPAKCDTIKKYVGEDYTIMASLGHVRDLATTGKGGLGVDVEHDFKTTYVVNKDKVKIVRSLKNMAKKSDEVILATDPDREGEAIAWHLASILKLPVETTKRLEFHEITRDSITHAIANPRIIDLNLVQSQETRRVVDRLIGFKLSALLYKKIHSRSAGRVQSATLKIIVDHEGEIEKFVPEEYWTFDVKGELNGQVFDLTIKVDKKDAKTKEDAEAIIAKIPETLTVTNVKKVIKTKESKEPFITSTLQQAAFNKFKYRTKQTQYIAQTLYEGLEIGDEHVGLITYMRTDSPRLSPTFIKRSQNYIEERFGKEYLGRVKHGKENEMSQDAHEAIRPTANHRTPESVKKYLNRNQYNLYKLIYDRAVASLMAAKKDEVTTVTLEGNGITFTLEGTHTLFDGFEALYKDNVSQTQELPKIEVNDVFKVVSKSTEQKFTQPPARYSEAKLVKIMEEEGIGRPSTYASTISILLQRKYVKETDGVLIPTEQGIKTSKVLTKYFPDIVNAEYTANMETQLDEIQAGSSHVTFLRDFYDPFIKTVDDAYKIMYPDGDEQTGELCPECGAPLVIKQGRNGKFIGCSNYPECHYVKREQKEPPRETGEMCPKCGKPLVYRKDKRGHEFIACSGFPECRYIKNDEKDAKEQNVDYGKCPECGAPLVKRRGHYGYFLGCSNFPKCKHMEKFEQDKKGEEK